MDDFYRISTILKLALAPSVCRPLGLSVMYPGNAKFRVLMIYPGDTRRAQRTAAAPEGRHLESLAHERRWGMSGVDLCIEFITTIMGQCCTIAQSVK